MVVWLLLTTEHSKQDPHVTIIFYMFTSYSPAVLCFYSNISALSKGLHKTWPYHALEWATHLSPFWMNQCTILLFYSSVCPTVATTRGTLDTARHAVLRNTAAAYNLLCSSSGQFRWPHWWVHAGACRNFFLRWATKPESSRKRVELVGFR